VPRSAASFASAAMTLRPSPLPRREGRTTTPAISASPGAVEVEPIGQRRGAPVGRVHDVEVTEVLAVEDDALRVDLGPAHAEAMKELEGATLHGRARYRGLATVSELRAAVSR
jgi:hypothetical protein